MIERGPLDQHEDPVIVPGLLDLSTTPYWYNLTSTPQRGLNNGTFQVPAAKVAGGGTVINGMFFDRGSAADYDAWEQLGNPGWGWSDLFPYFKKSETFTPADASLANDFSISWQDSAHGFSGPVRSSYPVYQYPSIHNFISAWTSLGVSTPKDPGAGTAYGVFWATSSLDPTDETRSYARVNHYDRVSYRSNYHLLVETAVSKISFKGKKAVGVELLSDEGATAVPVKAKKEVILAAGIHSSQILQLSGIGSKDVLDKYRIKSVADLPGVGSNFQDHATLYMALKYGIPIHPNADDIETNKTFVAEQLELYWRQRQGAYTITHFSGNVVAFLPLPNVTSDYQTIAKLALSSNGSASSYAESAGYNAQRSIISKLYESTEASVQETGFSSGSTVPITLVKPLSRGSVSIVSDNVFDEPAVDFGTFTHPSDIEIMIAAVRKNREMLSQPSMQELQPIELAPGANVITDAALRAALRVSVQPTYSHPCCTNPMMPEKLGGVVGPDLLVHGLDGLSVVDASIMPMIPATHLSATVYAVAEKAADMIKQRHGLL